MPQVLVRKCASRISCSCLFTETFLPRNQVFWHVIRNHVHLLLKEYFLPRSARQIHFFIVINMYLGTKCSSLTNHFIRIKRVIDSLCKLDSVLCESEAVNRMICHFGGCQRKQSKNYIIKIIEPIFSHPNHCKGLVENLFFFRFVIFLLHS